MKLVKALVIALVLSHGAHAEGNTPFRTMATKKVAKRARSHSAVSSSGYAARTIPTITFTTRLRTEGNVRVTLNVQKSVTWSATISRNGHEYVGSPRTELYQGEVVMRGARYPAAASVVGKRIILTFPGRQRGSRGSRQRIFTLSTPVVAQERSEVRVASSPSVVFHHKTCGLDHTKSDAPRHAKTIEPLNAGLPQTKMYHVLTLSTVADPALYAKYGVHTNAHVAGIVNAAEALFERQLGIRFQIVKQHVYADVGALSIPETDPGQLLRAFAMSGENAAVMGVNVTSFDDDVDLKHLFTGKDLDGATVGIAYVGAVCYLPKYAYSLTQVTSGGGAPYYFAHEVGHNLGARHDMTGSAATNLMSPTVMAGASFSQSSLDQINEHLLRFGSCLELKAMAPTLTDATISLRAVAKRGGVVTFSGKLISRNGELIAGSPIQLRIGKKVVPLTTNAKGRFSYTTPKRSLRTSSTVFVSTVGGEAVSEILRISRRR